MKIYQLYYNDKSKANCFDESEHFKCFQFKEKEDLKVNPYFENKQIRGLISKGDFKDDEYVGILSHKFTRKTGFEYKHLQEIDFKKDVVSFFRHVRSEKVLFNLDRWHKNGNKCLNSILWGLGRADMIGVTPDSVIYQNHFLAKGSVYKDYVNEWLIPAMDMCEEDSKLKSLLWEDAGYNIAIKDFGFDFPHHTFILERLPMLYFKYKGIEVQQEKPKMI